MMKKSNKTIITSHKPTSLPPLTTSLSNTGLSINSSNTMTDKSANLSNSTTNKQKKNVIFNKSITVLEDEVMGDNSKGNKSDILDKNLKQMIDVLKSRLNDLNNAANERINLCNHDLNASSKDSSSLAKKLGNELDEIIPKFKDNKSHRDNLISNSDNIQIDPIRLVFKSKQMTETAKKLENKLNDYYGNNKLRELIDKKPNKALNKIESHQSQQMRSEIKRQDRAWLERGLLANMENCISRSILDSDLIFNLPEEESSPVNWPIPVIWPIYQTNMTSTRSMTYKSSKQSTNRTIGNDNNNNNNDLIDNNSFRYKNMLSTTNNHDGDMDIDLILKYSIERVYIVSNEQLFHYLITKRCIQLYFLYLFWLIKIKFFQHGNNIFSTYQLENYLLNKLSIEYSNFIKLLSSRCKEEFEKDFIFKYMPYIYSNAVYFSFYYLCPGSRHLYTKGFRKTIYMQIVQIMFGIQLSSASIKVSWTKIFPEEIQDDEDNDENLQQQTNNNTNNITIGENIPVPIAYHDSEKTLEVASEQVRYLENNGFNISDINNLPIETINGINTIANDNAKQGTLSYDNDFNNNTLHRNKSTLLAPLNPSTSMNSIDLSRSNITTPVANTRPTTRQSMDRFTNNNTNTNTNSNTNINSRNLTSHDIIKILTEKDPLYRIHLQPISEKPNYIQNIEKNNQLSNNQNYDLNNTITNHPLQETLNANNISPLMQQYLHIPSASLGIQHPVLKRTIPVSWCQVGSTETYRKKVIPKEFYDDLIDKYNNVLLEYKTSINILNKNKKKSINKVNKLANQILASGITKISRYTLDLMKKQQINKSNKSNRLVSSDLSKSDNLTNTSNQQLDENFYDIVQAAQLDDIDLDQFFASIDI